jgi:hypothetical protein
VVEPGPVVLGSQIAVYVGHMMPAPGEGHHHDQSANILEMVPLKVVVQRTKALVQRAGHTSHPNHEAMLPEPLVNGR